VGRTDADGEGGVGATRDAFGNFRPGLKRPGDGEGGPDEQVTDAIVNANAGFVFQGGFGPTRSERRRGRNLHVIHWAWEYRGGAMWTPAMEQAVELFYFYGIPSARAARMLGINPASFGKRLKRAEELAHEWYATDRKDRTRDWKTGRPDARLTLSTARPH
jgi:hypothetical protein